MSPRRGLGEPEAQIHGETPDIGTALHTDLDKDIRTDVRHTKESMLPVNGTVQDGKMLPTYDAKADYDTSNASEVSSLSDSPDVNAEGGSDSKNKQAEEETQRGNTERASNNRSSGTGKRARTLLTPEQSRVLHELLQQTCFPSTQVREAVAAKLGLSPRKVQVFFQNKRQKQRKKNNASRPPQHALVMSSSTAPAAEPIDAHESRRGMVQTSSSTTYRPTRPQPLSPPSRSHTSTASGTPPMARPPVSSDIARVNPWQPMSAQMREQRMHPLSPPRMLMDRQRFSPYTTDAARYHPYEHRPPATSFHSRHPTLPSSAARFAERPKQEPSQPALPPIHSTPRAQKQLPRLPSINELIASSTVR